MCQVNLVRLQNGGGFNSDEGTITVRTVCSRTNSRLGPAAKLSLVKQTIG